MGFVKDLHILKASGAPALARAYHAALPLLVYHASTGWRRSGIALLPVSPLDYPGPTPHIRYRWLTSRPKPLQQTHVSHACTLTRGRLFQELPVLSAGGPLPQHSLGGLQGFSLSY